MESPESWFQRTDAALYAAKAGGRNRIHVDRRGTSDFAANQTGMSLLRLQWQEAYECGEPTIDAEHRELFELGNALIAAAFEQDTAPESLRTALDSLLAHVVLHFRHEEEVLARRRYPRLAAHRGAHAALVRRARELQDSFHDHGGALGPLVSFIARDVIAEHMFKVDRDFYPLFRKETRCATSAVR